jgi:hypothetical protein
LTAIRDLDRRRAALVTALAATQLDTPPEFRHEGVDAVKAWLGTWNGLGAAIVGMVRQGYDLDLTCFEGRAWRASFYRAGRIHSATWDSGSAFEPSPFMAVQKAALETLTQREPTERRSVHQEQSPE